MELKELLTNERLTKRFNSLFELVNYSIRCAEELIKTGREPRVKTEIQNPMHRILLEILNEKDEPVSIEQLLEVRERTSRTSRESHHRGSE